MKNSILNTRFNNSIQRNFTKILNARVNEYFKSRNLGRYANSEMILKTFVMFGLYFIPYSFVMAGWFQNNWVFYILQIFMGIGLAGIGLSVMHDANHGAYSRNRQINRILGYSLNLVGANATNWKIQHNVKHHTYTNVEHHDEDIFPKGGVIRLSPNSDRKKVHRYQHIYVWFLYGLMTITWITYKDFIQLLGYTKDGILKRQQPVAKAWTWLVGTKLFYYGYILILPMIFSPYNWIMILLGFLVMHYVAGFILAIVFQPAHVVEENHFELVNDKQFIDENWLVYQLKTTCNFAPKNRLLSWYVGGLNYQIEHHLFPNICHVHYRKISKIVRETAQEFNLPYRSFETFWDALISHGRMLKTLGRA